MSTSRTKTPILADYYGAAVMVPAGSRFLWVISPKDLWKRINGRQYVSYSGIGGNVEAGESFTDAAVRECKEETGCVARILPSPKTFLLDEVNEVLKEARISEASPLMIVRKKVRGRKTLLFHTFLAELRGTPRPSSEIPALIFTPARELLRSRTVTVRETIQNGSELVERGAIPRSAGIRPWGAPYYLRQLIVRRLISPKEFSW